MLNRRLSQYIFYGSLAVVTIIVLLINYFLMESMNADIDRVNQESIALQAQIDELVDIVQDNKNAQTSYIYELYDQVPGTYSGTELVYQTISVMERLGITESDDYGREVYVHDDVNFGAESIFGELSTKYQLVEVEIFFTTQDITLVENLLDELYLSNQIFIVNEISYSVPNGEDFLGINITLITMYDTLEVEEESN